MTMNASADQVGTALERMRFMLGADGYDLDVVGVGERIELAVRATPEACEECLVPKDIMTSIAVNMLREGGIAVSESQVDLTYPAEGAGH